MRGQIEKLSNPYWKRLGDKMRSPGTNFVPSGTNVKGREPLLGADRGQNPLFVPFYLYY